MSRLAQARAGIPGAKQRIKFRGFRRLYAPIGCYPPGCEQGTPWREWRAGEPLVYVRRYARKVIA